MLNKNLLFIVFLLCTFFLRAQEPVSIHITEKDGLPDIEFYSVYSGIKKWIKTKDKNLIEGAFWLAKYKNPQLKLDQIFSALDKNVIIEGNIGRYTVESVATLATMRYRMGMPFYRLEGIEDLKNVSLSETSMWDAVKSGSHLLSPLYEELQKYVANCGSFRVDDGSTRINSQTTVIKEEKKLMK